MENQTFNIVTAQSNIDWVGKKVTGAHNGTIGIKAGEIVVTDGKVESGTVVVDTTSIKILDVTDPATNAQFLGHLVSDDFFSTEKFQDAVLEITEVDGNNYAGNLTIKGITQAVNFTANATISGDTLTAKGTIIIDRTLYGMRFRSGNFFKSLGDTLIYNDFELTVSITAKAA